jgi:hypothetical protein
MFEVDLELVDLNKMFILYNIALHLLCKLYVVFYIFCLQY